MRKLDARLAELSGRGEGAFAPFLVLGDPDPGSTSKWIEAIAASGPDLFEFGFPFSDPPADGPVIQAADARALATGTTPEHCFEILAAARSTHAIPAALLVYANIVQSYGLERFYARSHPSPFAIYGASRGDPSKPDEPPSLYCELTPQRVAEYQRQRPEKSLDAFVRPLAREMYPELDAH